MAQAAALAGMLEVRAESGEHMIGTNPAVQPLVPQEQVESLVAEMVAAEQMILHQVSEDTAESLEAEAEAEALIVLVALVGKEQEAKLGFMRTEI